MSNTYTLFQSILRGDKETVKNLLAQGVDANIKPPPDTSDEVWELSPLREAIVAEQIEIVRLLLEAGADTDVDFALLMAVCMGYKNSVPPLLEYGANPNIRDDEGSVPLKEAAWSGSLEMVTALLDAGADVNYSGGMSGMSVLAAAAMEGHVEVVRLLLKYGADVNLQDVDDNTVLKRLASSTSWEEYQSPEIKQNREAVAQMLEEAAGFATG